MSDDYQLVPLANGKTTLFSAHYGEKLHPGLGPQAEAELLYVRQLKICERMQSEAGEFVIWDVGLGAAANALAALSATREISGRLRLVSFDNTAEPLAFALKNAAALGYVAGYETQLAELLHAHHVAFQNGKLAVDWEFHLGDFPAWLARFALAGHSLSPRGTSGERAGVRGVLEPLASSPQPSPPSAEEREKTPPPHAIFYDAFSPAKNPAMWTRPVFENLFRALDPARPCALTTYSRSTLLRTTLLLAGFFVGTGHATGAKEETTIAANTLDLIAEPLNARWLERARRSDSAEPLRHPVYVRAPLAPDTAEKLKRHPQFTA
jgi:tRNA U34 5-methylaminomethyl-2-thiouridine-forming methyltransferase MnmC